MSKPHLRKLLFVLTLIYCGVVIGYGLYHTKLYRAEEALKASQAQTELSPPQPELLAIGTIAPNFTLNDLNNHAISLSQYRHQKSVLIEIFASWCPHCQHSVPFLNTLQHQYPHLKVLAINGGDKPPAMSTAPAFKTRFKVHYTILDNPSESLLTAYHVAGIPTLYWVDPNGVIQWSHRGEIKPDVYASLKKTLHKLSP